MRGVKILVSSDETERILNSEVEDITDDIYRLDNKISKAESRLTRVTESLSQGGLSRSQRRALESRRDDLLNSAGDLLRQRNSLRGDLDNARSNIGELPLITVPANELTSDELSNLSYYWNDVQAMVNGRTGQRARSGSRSSQSIESWRGYRVGGYELETDPDVIYSLFFDGEIDFEDMYEEV